MTNDRILEARERIQKRDALLRELEALKGRDALLERRQWSKNVELAERRQDAQNAEQGGWRAVLNNLGDCLEEAKGRGLEGFMEAVQARAPFGERGLSAVVKGLTDVDSQQERAVALEAEKAVDAVKEERSALREQIMAKQWAIQALGDCDGDYARLLSEKECALREKEAEEVRRLRAAADEADALADSMGETFRQGRRAKKLAESVQTYARRAIAASGTMNVYVEEDRAEAQVEPFEREARRFLDELRSLAAEGVVVDDQEMDRLDRCALIRSKLNLSESVNAASYAGGILNRLMESLTLSVEIQRARAKELRTRAKIIIEQSQTKEGE